MSDQFSFISAADYSTLRKNELISLTEMAQAVFGSFEIKIILNSLIRYVASVIEVSRCSVILTDHDKRYARVISTYENPDLDELRVELSKYPEIQQVFQTKRPLYINDAGKDNLMKGVKKDHNQIGSYSFMVLPLSFEDEFLGVLFVRTASGRTSFSINEKVFCRISATAAAKALINARLFASVQDNFKNTVVSMAKSLEKRDEYTHGHSEKVSDYSLKIASKLRISRADKDILRYASLLHDIGKIGIRDSILRKHGPLTQEERNEILKHPQYGVEILSPVNGMDLILPLVKHHHEFFNGQGYPLGLKGEEIPLGARIITITDSFEAMSANRPYRNSLDISEIIKRLKSCSGTQFDPKLIEIFLKIIPTGKK
jgi:putative nucleotidyltransferase with HDIG domain